MKQEEKHALIRAFAKEYKRSGKKERGRIPKAVFLKLVADLGLVDLVI